MYPGWNRADGAAMRMSAFIASDTPAPTATPFTPARIGFSHSTLHDDGEVCANGVLAVRRRVARRSGRGAGLGEVEPRAEPVAVAGEHDGPHVVVGRRLAEGTVQRVDEPAIERVLAFGTVQAQHAQATFVADLERLAHWNADTSILSWSTLPAPSTAITWPDTNRAAGLHRYSSMCAMSAP